MLGDIADATQLWLLLLAILLSALTWWWWIRPAVGLLAGTLYVSATFGYLRAVGEAFRFFAYRTTGQSFYQTARYRIEAELLAPRPRRPQRFEFAADVDYTEELRCYRREKRKWRRKVREQLRALVDPPHLIVVETCFDLQRAELDIRRYFAALTTRTGVRDDNIRFLSKVRVQRGFVAPLYLLGGLLARFEENWKPVIGEYGRAVTRKGDPLRHRRLRRLQTFLFDCWLMWGPSIPICTCPQWGGRHLLQFGFGDEDNSIMLMPGKTGPVDLTQLQTDGGYTVLARQARVTGTLRWGPSIEPDPFCTAQQAVFESGDGRLVLESDEFAFLAGKAEDAARTYYSAYMWVMFVICDAEGEPLIRNDRWRNLLPFFEHSNIADQYTYTVLKDQLVVKALSSIAGILEDTPDIQLRYACAIDDPVCGSRLTCPPLPGDAIWELLDKTLRLGHFSKLAASRRLVIDPMPWYSGDYSACHLPDVLQDYFRSIPSGTDT